MKSFKQSCFCFWATLLLLVFTMADLHAEALSPEQAKQVASHFVNNKIAKHPSAYRRVRGNVPKQSEMKTEVVFDATDQSGHPCLYAVNLPQENGYVLVSGDDRFAEVLGYSDEHAFNVQNMPDNMREWLQGYINEMTYLESVNYTPAARRTPAASSVIRPLIETKWNQRAPYNNLCPFDTYNNLISVTGCVATAMAQVVNYHIQHYNAPTAIVTEIEGYTTQSNKLAVSAVPAGTLLPDKSLLRNTYNDAASDEQNEAVAQLMAYCGASVQMNYSAAASSAPSTLVPNALVKHFGFDNTTRIVDREQYRYADWVEMMYNELAASRPVYYSGSSSGGGHAFVVDGFDGDGLFHVNWGWGGYCDDYFALSVLNPDDNGQVGASSSSDGYNMVQKAVIGIQINTGQTMEQHAYLSPEILSVDNDNHTISFSAYNMTGETRSFNYGIIGFVEEDGTITPIGNYSTSSDLKPNWGWNSLTCTVPVNRSYANQTKKIVPISREAGATTWFAGANTDVHYVSATYNASGVPFLTIHPIRSLRINSLTIPTGQYVNQAQSVNISVTNTAEEFYGLLYLFASLDATKGEPVASLGITALENNTQNISFEWTPTAIGSYNLWVTTDEAGENVMFSSTVAIKEDASLVGRSMIIASLSFDNQDKNSFHVDDNGIRAVDVYSNYLTGTVSVKNITSASISRAMKIDIEQLNEQTGQYESDKTNNSHFSFTLSAGRTTNLSIDRGPFETGKTYRVALAVYNTQPVEYLDDRYIVHLRDTAAESDILASGACGDNLTWELSKDGVLTISGTGAMWRLTDEQVWRPYKDNITTVILPEGIDSIAPHAFYNCTNLTSVNMPNSVVALGNNAFVGCDKLTEPVYNKRIFGFMPRNYSGSYSIPEGIVSVAAYAFAGCRSLTEIILPSSVLRLGISSLNAANLTSITCYAIEPPTCNTNVFANTSIPLYVPAESLRRYKAADQWKNFTDIHAIGGDIEEPVYPIYVHLHDSVLDKEIGQAVISMDRDTALFEEYELTYHYYEHMIYVNRIERNQWVLMARTTPRYNVRWWLPGFVQPDTLHLNVEDTTDVTLVVSQRKYYVHLYTDDYKQGLVGTSSYEYAHVDTVFYSSYGDSTEIIAIPREGYKFVRWSDGNTNNPRFVTSTQNIDLSASFEPSACLLASGYCGAEGDNLTWELSCDSILTISGTGAMVDWSTYNDVPWYEKRDIITAVIIKDGATKVGDYAFWAHKKIISLTIPNSVITIGQAAFYYCSSLKSVSLPDNLSSIGPQALQFCKNLSSLWIPSSVTEIGWDALSDCSNLSSISVSAENTSFCAVDGVLFDKNKTTIIQYPPSKAGSSYSIPNGVVIIGRMAFSDCKNLTYIAMPNTIKTSKGYAFSGCTNLQSIDLSSSMISITSSDFDRCSSLEAINVPEDNQKYCSVDGVFFNKDMTTLLIFPSSHRDTAYIIPQGVTSIGNEAFISTRNLKSVSIPEGVTSIGSEVFYGSSLTSLILPSSMRSIQNIAFWNCSKLRYIKSKAVVPPTLGDDVFKNVDTSIPLYVPAESIDIYKAADQWKDFTNILPIEEEPTPCLLASGYCGAEGDSTNLRWELSCDSVLTIIGTGEMAEYTYGNHGLNAPWTEYASHIKSVQIEEGVTSIGTYAFYNYSDAKYSSLKDITIPSSLTKTGANIFSGLSSIEAVYISDLNAWINIEHRNSSGNPLSVAHHLYVNGVELVDLVIPDGINKIKPYTFCGCTGLKSLQLPNDLTHIGNGAFQNCTGLTTLTLPEGMKIVDNSAFYKCTSLETLYISSTVQRLGNCSFEGCSGLKGVYITDFEAWCNMSIEYSSPLKFAHHLYLNNEELTDVTIPKSCKKIEEYVFEGCSFINNIHMHDSITHIGHFAFNGCTALQSIVIPENVIYIGSSAFNGCSGLQQVEFLSTTPPEFFNNWGARIFMGDNDATYLVPCALREAYIAALNTEEASPYIVDDSRIIEHLPYSYTLLSHSEQGAVVLLQQPVVCADMTLSFRADAKEGYQFKQWSDGNTDNPRTIEVTRDTTLTAEFVPANCLLASGTCGAEGDNLTWELSCDSVLTISGNGAMADFRDTMDIPWQIYRQTAIKRVVLPEGMTYIGENAFEECYLLDTVRIPQSVSVIGETAFRSCGVQTLMLPDNLQRIGEGAFAHCQRLWRVFIPRSVEYIGDGAFSSCSTMQYIEIEDENPVYTSMDGILMSKDSTVLIQYPSGRIDSTYFVPENCDTIRSYAFTWVPELKHIYFYTNRAPYMRYTFNYSDYTFHIPCGAKEEYMAVLGVYESHVLEDINMLEYKLQLLVEGRGNVDTSSNWKTCEAEEMELTAAPSSGYYFLCWSDSVKDNPRTVLLHGDSSFTAVFAPKSFTIDVYSADTTMGSVTDLHGTYLYGTTLEIIATPKGGYAFKGWSDQTASVFPCQAYPVVRSLTVMNNTTITAQFGDLEEPTHGTCGDNLEWVLDCDGVLTISGNGAMLDWDNEKDVPWFNKDSKLGAKDYLPIRSVIIEEGITGVGRYAFRKCSTIVSISLPKTLISIGEQAFRYSQITELIIPGSVTTIEYNAFSECKLLTDVTCYATTPPTNDSESRFFYSSQSIRMHVPCGSMSAYKSASAWKYWTFDEIAPDYRVENAVVLQEPTCLNEQVLIFQAKERAGYFFEQWSDGNTDNPRTVQLTYDAPFAVEAQYVAGVAEMVCPGYIFDENGEQIIIDRDTVIGYHHFFVYTNNLPVLTAEDGPIKQSGRISYKLAEKRLREEFAKVNRNAPEITSVLWNRVANESGEEIAEYIINTVCGDTLYGYLPFIDKGSAEAPAPFATSGKDFWVALSLATSAEEGREKTPSLTINADKSATVTISNPAIGWQAVYPVNGTAVITDIPLQVWYPKNANTLPEIARKAGAIHALGLHIEATEEISVVATQYMSTSMDATTVLPTHILRSDYIIQDYPPYNNDESYGTFAVLATENNTTVFVIPSSTTMDGHAAEGTYAVVLNRGEVYYGLSQNQQSLSGTRITASPGTKIAVFQGDVLTQVPAGLTARDCLYEQAVPVEYWGTEFIVTRSLNKDANRVRVTASADNTQLLISGQRSIVLNTGDTYEFEMSIGDLSRRHTKLLHSLPLVIQADAVWLQASMPVAVYSYDVGKSYQAEQTEMYGNAGDPSMVWIAPLNHRATNVAFTTLSTANGALDHFVNIVTETVHCRETMINKQKVAEWEWQPVPENPVYSYARVSLSLYDDTYYVENPVGCIIHVYAHGNNESYAYSVGPRDNGAPYAVHVQENNCIIDPVWLELVGRLESVDYIDWEFGDGQTIHDADRYVEHQYRQVGEYEVKAKVYTHREEPLTLYAPLEYTAHISVSKPDTLYRDYRMCQGESFVHNGVLYSEATEATIIYDCDSVEIFTLTIDDCSVEPQDTVVVEPEETKAGFTWTIVPGTETYVLIVWADPEHTVRLCTLTFNKAGYLVNIDFGVPNYAPAYRLNTKEAPKSKRLLKQISVGTTTLNFTITGLESGHEYYYDLYAYNVENEEIDAKTGSFITVANSPTGIERNPTDEVPVKVLLNGRILIIRGERIYTLTGQEMK